MINVTTTSYMEVVTEVVVARWSLTLDKVQLTCAIIGMLANFTTLFVLLINVKVFSPGVHLLLKNQSFVDAISCTMAVVLLVETQYWKTGALWIDIVICHTWHSQCLYWGSINLSVLNLLLISIERFIAVVKPFLHSSFTRRYLKWCIFAIYIVNPIEIFPGFIQSYYDEEKDICIGEYLFNGVTMETFFYYYSIAWLFVYYLIPLSLFCVLYGGIIFSLKKQNSLSKSKISGKQGTLKIAQIRMTQIGFCVTLIFILTVGFDPWYYALGYTHVTAYVFGSKMQKIGVFLAVLNCVLNPFVYIVLMPAFRRACLMTLVRLCPCRRTGRHSSTEPTSNATTSDVEINSLPTAESNLSSLYNPNL